MACRPVPYASRRSLTGCSCYVPRASRYLPVVQGDHQRRLTAVSMARVDVTRSSRITKAFRLISVYSFQVGAIFTTFCQPLIHKPTRDWLLVLVNDLSLLLQSKPPSKPPVKTSHTTTAIMYTPCSLCLQKVTESLPEQ